MVLADYSGRNDNKPLRYANESFSHREYEQLHAYYIYLFRCFCTGGDGIIARQKRHHSLALSERTFLRHFCAATGQTPKIWLQHERMHKAKALLERDQVNIAGIAEYCGFQTMEGFRNAFRQIVGITPAVYRRQFKYN